MKMQISRIVWNLFENLDITLGIGCAIIGAGILYLSLIGRINQHIIATIVIISSVAYLLLRRRLNEKEFQNYQLSWRQKTALDIIFCILIIITSVLWYNQLYSRPLVYFIIVSLITGLIAIEIFLFTGGNSELSVLIKILVLTFVMRLELFYNFPSIMGFDAFFHATLANLISTTGSIPPFDISTKYINYPILHILIAVTKIIASVPVKDAVFFSIGILSIACTIFIFVFVKRFAGPRVGLLSVLIICFTIDIIVTGITNITAGSVVLCYFLILLYLLIDRQRKSNAMLLSLIIMFTMVITHQLSTFVVFLVFYLISFSLMLYEHRHTLKNNKIELNLFLALFGITMIFYWIYTPLNLKQSFFDGVLAPFLRILQTGGSYGSDLLIIGHEYNQTFMETFLLQLSYLVLPFFAIGGIFFWLSRRDEIKFSVAFTSGVLFFLVYAIPMLGIRNLLTDRWMPFLSVFLGIVAAGYIISCVELFKTNAEKIAAVFVIISLMSFLMIIPPVINKDNPFAGKDRTIRNQFKFNEIAAINTITLFQGGSIVTDTDFKSLFSLYGRSDSLEGTRNISDTVSSFQSEKQLRDESGRSGSLTVLRKNELIKLKASQLYGDSYVSPLSNTTFEFFENAGNHNLVFTNGNIIGYYTN